VQAQVITAAKRLSDASAALKGIVSVTVTVMDNPLCLEQFRAAIKLCQAALSDVASAGESASSDKTYSSHLKGEVKLTMSALAELDALVMSKTKGGKRHKASRKSSQSDQFTSACLGLTSAADGLGNALGSAPDMLSASTAVAKAASMVVALILGKATLAEKHKKAGQAAELRGLSQTIKETSGRLVAAAKAVAEAPTNSNRQQELLHIGYALGGLGIRAKQKGRTTRY